MIIRFRKILLMGGGLKLTGSESNKPPKVVTTTEAVAESLKNKSYANILQAKPEHEKGRGQITVVSQCSHPKKTELPDEDKRVMIISGV
ncbi:hypothetical protein [Endozoicomonas atrinae]|uniref:hypothetical protein n=1 Tax=Endozoicomonas atrinae TaxID=1333660 RepID=UPI003B007F9D